MTSVNATNHIQTEELDVNKKIEQAKYTYKPKSTRPQKIYIKICEELIDKKEALMEKDKNKDSLTKDTKSMILVSIITTVIICAVTISCVFIAARANTSANRDDMNGVTVIESKARIDSLIEFKNQQNEASKNINTKLDDISKKTEDIAVIRNDIAYIKSDLKDIKELLNNKK